MLRTELKEIIANGENSGVEFKRDDVRPEQLAKEFVALLNFQGGCVILGVEDDGTPAGLTRDNTEEWVMNVIRDKVHPIALPFYERIEVGDGIFVAVIVLQQGISKPYVLRHNKEEKVYIRIGSTSQLATREQQMRLFELGGVIHLEAMPVPRTDINCLDLERLLNYFRDIIQDPELPQTPDAWESRLLGLGFLAEAARPCCSIAGLVLFGKNPRRFLKQSGLRVFAFDGENKEYQAQLDDIIDGPLVGRFEADDSGKRLLDGGIIERFIDLVGPFLSEEASIIDGNFRREKNWDYPIDAVREVVVNALAHRDWTRYVEIEIGLYSNRFEVISPGTLPNSMTVQKMVSGQRSPRNMIIMDVLRDYGYVDSRGMGIRNKVIPLMRKRNRVEPVFEATEDYLKTVLYKAQ